ncbi:MAG: TlpA family protein disulfide reductase, partial [Terriglobales bacterium]
MRAACLTLLALLVGLQAGCTRHPAPGEAVPGFQLTLRDGQQVSLASYRGKVVVLNFWASW